MVDTKVNHINTTSDNMSTHTTNSEHDRAYIEVLTTLLGAANDKAKIDQDSIKQLAENMIRLETENDELKKKQEQEWESSDCGQAQRALYLLKTSIHNLLKAAGQGGVRNVDIARQLGIRGGIGPRDDIRHRDWISKTILCMLERGEEVAEQIGTRWYAKSP